MKSSDIVQGRLVEFLTDDKVVLNGFLVGRRRSRRCVVYVHGMTGNFYGGKTQFAIAKRIDRLGYSVFSINTRGHDAVSVIKVRKGRKLDRLMAGTDLERFEDSHLDIGGAISRLRKLGFREFVLAGHSTGCQKVTYYQYKTRDRGVKGLLLLAPADDNAIYRKEQGKRFEKVFRLAKEYVRQGKGNEPSKEVPSHYSPRRFLSLVDPKNVESRIFDYEGGMREFSKIKVPICAVFGSKEEYATKPVAQYLNILRNRTSSEDYVGAIIDGANHSFRNHNDVTSDFVAMWLSGLGKKKIPTHEILEINRKFPLASLGYS